jgi:hypothetical protein
VKGSFKTALIAAIVSAIVAAGAAVATTQTFVLGTTDRVNAATKVTNLQANGTTVNPVDAPLMAFENKSGTANATPLSLIAASGHSPLKVNTQVKVANLNADQLDGRDSSYFLPKTSKVADADRLDGLDSSEFVRGQSRLITFAETMEPGEAGAVMSAAGNTLYGVCYDYPASGLTAAFSMRPPDATHTIRAWWFNKDGEDYATLDTHLDQYITAATNQPYTVVTQWDEVDANAFVSVTASHIVYSSIVGPHCRFVGSAIVSP